VINRCSSGVGPEHAEGDAVTGAPSRGRGSRRRAARSVAGVVVQIRGGSVIFDSLAVGPWSLCRVGTCPGGVPWHTRGAGLWKDPLHNKLALLLALAERKYIRKDLSTSRDGRI
jgi:hypothetical protein